MNVLQNLMELYNSLPMESTYRVVAKGILENLQDMADMTIYEVAEMTNSSRTTVWRMVQKMGYKNYTDFRFALKAAVTQYTYYNRLIPMEASQNLSQIVSTFTSKMRNDCDVLDKYLSYEQVFQFIEALHQAKRICFYLPYRLYAVYSLQQNLAMTGKETSYVCLLPDMLEDVQSVDEKSLILFGTIEFAETLDMSPVFKVAKERGATIILASDHKSRYNKYADQLLFDFNKNSEERFSMNSALEIFLLSVSEMYRTQYIK